MNEHYDVIIIGTGAGGGTLARQLAPTGANILILERGGFIPRERENMDPHAVAAEGRYLAKETWYDKDDQPFSPYTHYGVGGNTKVYGAALLRLRESDFREVRHWAGVSPAWPIEYAELEPYYCRAERMYSVHGDRGADPTEPWSSESLPFGAMAPEPRIAEMFDELTRAGLKPFPVPLGVRLGEHRRGSAPVRLSNFDGYPDPMEVKADSHVCGVRPAMDYPNVTLVIGAFVQRLVTSADGRRVTTVVVRHEGREQRYTGGVVVVACGAINSAALMLRSANDRHPHGLANSSGLVGRNYMTHHNGLFIAVQDVPNPSLFQKHFGLTDFYHGAPDSEFPLGTVQLMGKPDLGTIASLAKDALPGVPAEQIARHTVDFFLTAEDLPSERNRVSLRADGSIRIEYHDTNAEAYARLERRLIEAIEAADRLRGAKRPSVYLRTRLGVSGVSHQNGTMRFGIDPRASVLDVNCRAHDVENLYVADASFFPSSGAVNPSLTIMANALRVGDRLIETYGWHRGAKSGACKCAVCSV